MDRTALRLQLQVRTIRTACIVNSKYDGFGSHRPTSRRPIVRMIATTKMTAVVAVVAAGAAIRHIGEADARPAVMLTNAAVGTILDMETSRAKAGGMHRQSGGEVEDVEDVEEEEEEVIHLIPVDTTRRDIISITKRVVCRHYYRGVILRSATEQPTLPKAALVPTAVGGDAVEDSVAT